ncbi:UDP-glucose 4-epimerase family protein [Shewanella spartinae]|uniref:UDP-glucose 4-epimerase family protein n=1 Tax=Shewanella spartinae TaxID=2864205 RepID=UPI001C6595B5|nr:SDR family oxidoreductase [Shewanella spartinae]QYJ95161.1 SDR family oxidoreductase [Shewanella spartinae]
MILVTGATGFIGSHILSVLGNSAVVLSRKPVPNYSGKYITSDLTRPDFSEDFFEGIEVVIHCAARVHVMSDKSADPLSDFRIVNTIATIELAKAAAKSGVKRFIFISSIKVNGELTKINYPFKATDIRNPSDYYGVSKSEAEIQLMELGNKTSMEIVIIRPSLVYGPGVKGNFHSLMELVYKGLPLPLGCVVNNRRSLVSIVNLVDLIVTCIDHPKASNQVFLVSDDNDISTSSMVKKIADAMTKKSWQLPIPVWCYKIFGKLFNRLDIVNRLVGSLQVDISHTKDTLDWVPPQTLEDGFKETAEAFLLNKK